MLWKFKMETMLKARELWGLVDGKDVAALSAYTKKENQALNLIMQSLFDNQLLAMRKQTTVKGIWEALQNQYVDKGFINRLFLTRKFFTSQMNPTNTMEQHLNKLITMVEELNAIGATNLLKVKFMVW